VPDSKDVDGLGLIIDGKDDAVVTDTSTVKIFRPFELAYAAMSWLGSEAINTFRQPPL
jgi:hypothetical protein